VAFLWRSSRLIALINVMERHITGPNYEPRPYSSQGSVRLSPNAIFLSNAVGSSSHYVGS
jgi:hypothetical protein